MIAKEIEYFNYKGEPKKGTYYFHLRPGQLMRVQADTISKGYEDLGTMIQDLVKKNKLRDAYEVVENLLILSYGEMSDDGESFVQSEEVTSKFKNSAVLDGLVIDILSTTDKSIEFFNGLIPRELMEKVVNEQDASKETSGSNISVVK